MAKHWLYEWIDEFSVRDMEDAHRKFKLPGSVFRLHEIAQAAQGAENDQPSGRAIVAGSTIDFSARLSCSHPGCLKIQVDRLFGSIWHYFDSVVVEGPSAQDYVSRIEEKFSSSELPFSITVGLDVEFLLYLRDSGLIDYLSFREKAHNYCFDHIQSHAEDLGLSHYFDPQFKRDLAGRLKREGAIDITQRGNGWHYSLQHATLPEPFQGSFRSQSKGRMPKKPTKQQAAEAVVARSAAALVRDVATSRIANLPLALEIPFLQPSIDTQGERLRVQNIALELPLPVMHGMSAQDAVLLRKDLRPHFERFQHALTLAIHEQILRDPNQENSQVARAVSDEFIRPELAGIERALKESKRSLSVKTGSTFAVGTTLASSGLLFSVPLVVASGLAAVGISLASLNKFFDEGRDVRTSDVYFLWKATRQR